MQGGSYKCVKLVSVVSGEMKVGGKPVVNEIENGLSDRSLGRKCKDSIKCKHYEKEGRSGALQEMQGFNQM